MQIWMGGGALQLQLSFKLSRVKMAAKRWNCTHILFVEVDHALLKRDIFGLVSFAELLKNLPVKRMVAHNHKDGREGIVPTSTLNV